MDQLGKVYGRKHSNQGINALKKTLILIVGLMKESTFLYLTYGKMLMADLCCCLKLPDLTELSMN
jgi:hypothetical protein